VKIKVIAELGSTTNGDFHNAIRAFECFAALGADAVKLQCHLGEAVPEYQPHPSPRVKEPRAAYYVHSGFASDEWAVLARAAHENGLQWVVSPFSTYAARMLMEHARPDAWKVASGQVTNLPMLGYLATTEIPVLLSSGMTTPEEDHDARAAVPGALPMLCTSAYPCPAELVALHHRPARGPWGYSDHTMGMAASLAAITLGATVIERHVTLSRELYGSDAAHSLEPAEFGRFVQEVRFLETVLSSSLAKRELAHRLQPTREVFLWREHS
jgi:N,N'-diacetyllegionaminate synthase